MRNRFIILFAAVSFLLTLSCRREQKTPQQLCDAPRNNYGYFDLTRFVCEGEREIGHIPMARHASMDGKQNTTEHVPEALVKEILNTLATADLNKSGLEGRYRLDSMQVPGAATARRFMLVPKSGDERVQRLTYETENGKPYFAQAEMQEQNLIYSSQTQLLFDMRYRLIHLRTMQKLVFGKPHFSEVVLRPSGR